MLESQINFAFIKSQQFQSSVARKVPRAQKSCSEGTKELFYLTEDEVNQFAFLHLFLNTISVQNTGVSMGKGGRNELKSCLFDTVTVFFFKRLVSATKKVKSQSFVILSCKCCFQSA